MWLQRGSRCWPGSAQAWGSAPRICAALPGSNQVHWPLLGKRLFPTSLQMILKDNVRCQRHCNSHLDKEKGISVPWQGLEVRGIPKGTVSYLFPHLSITGRGQKGSQHRDEASESMKFHKCSSYTTCPSMAVLCKSQRWRIKISALLEFTTGNSYNYHHPFGEWHELWQWHHKTQGRDYWLGKEGGTGGLWRKVSIPAGLWSLRKKSEGTAFKEGENVGKSEGNASSQFLNNKGDGALIG